MLTGFNTDIECRGRVFHVQTQEKGLADPVVESLVYCGGEIVSLVRFSYGALVDTPDYSDEAVHRLMEYQHLRTIRDIRQGKHSHSTGLPDAGGPMREKSLDEIVLEYLERSVDEAQRIELAVEHVVDRSPRARASQTTSVEDDAGPVDNRPTEEPEYSDSARVKRERTLAERRVLERLEKFLDAAQREAARAAVTTETSRVAVSTPRRPRHRAAVWVVVMVAPVLGAVLYFSPPPGQWDRGSAAAPVTAVRRDATPARSGVEPSVDLPPPVSEPALPDVARAGAAPEPAGPEPGQPSAAQSPISRPVTPRQTRPPAAQPVPTASVAREDQPPEPVVGTDPSPLAAASITPPPTAVLDETLPDGPAAAAAPKAAPRIDWTGRLVDLASVDVPPRPTKRDLPRYTKRARRLRQQGVVTLELLVSETGQVVDARSLESIPDSDLEQAALTAARTWQFTPALKAGDPVQVWMPVSIEFSVSAGKATRVRVR